MKLKKFVYVWLIAPIAATAWLLTSCDDSSSGSVGVLSTPEIIQSEEVSDNPISLSFSWEAVENARKYNYKLVDGSQNVIAQGSTGNLNVKFVHGENVSLQYDAQYTFSLQALPAANNWEPSEFATSQATTDSGELQLTLEAVNYRTIRFWVIPKDKSMSYDMGSTTLERYTRHQSDMEFINDIGFGYYQTLAGVSGQPWAEIMKYYMKVGKSEVGQNKRLRPGTEYVAFAYGVSFKDDVNAEDPVEVITPLVVKSVKAPEWKATSNTTFELGEIKATKGENGSLSLTVEVTPSDDQTRYYVAFYENANLISYGSNQNFAFSMIESDEDQYRIMNNGEELNWGTTNWLYCGKQTVSTTTPWGAWEIGYGKPFTVFVFGVDKDGLITTNITQKEHNGFAEQDVE